LARGSPRAGFRLCFVSITDLSFAVPCASDLRP